MKSTSVMKSKISPAKRILAASLIGAMMLVTSEYIPVKGEETTEQLTIAPIEEQLSLLYNSIGNKLLMDSKYVALIHMLGNSNTTYADLKPNIYKDQLAVGFDVCGVEYNCRVYDVVETDPEILRGTNTFLPDALYSVCYDIAVIMGQRYQGSHDGLQIYFDTLNEDTKKEIVFCESVLQYIGESEENIQNVYRTYEKLLYDKQALENVIEIADGHLEFKEKFKGILEDNGFVSKNSQKVLAVILSYDAKLAAADSVDTLSNEYVTPYRKNYTSRENMMVAAASLVGKVHYVWGGGHSGACYIDGINPMWAVWNSLYPANEYTIDADGKQVRTVGYNTCIKPSGSWCPTHGYVDGVCSWKDEIHSLDEYIQRRKDLLPEIDSDKFRNLMKYVDFSDDITIHTFEGLDCSGFASWLYNQITSKYTLNSRAVEFTKQNGLVEIPFGEKLLPGDIFSWTTHIVVVVGPVRKDSKAYVTVEQTTNVLKFGALYYSGASSSDIAQAKQIALEANQLIGGLYGREAPHVYCMNETGKYTEDVPLGDIDASQANTTDGVNLNVVVNGEEVKVLGSDWEQAVQSALGQVEEAEEVNAEVEEVNAEAESETDEVEQVDNEVGQVDGAAEQVDSETGEDIQENAEPTVKVNKITHTIGRFADGFIDENTPMPEYDRPIKDLTAQEIIQHTLSRLPISYATGYNYYSGELFDKSKVATNVGY